MKYESSSIWAPKNTEQSHPTAFHSLCSPDNGAEYKHILFLFFCSLVALMEMGGIYDGGLALKLRAGPWRHNVALVTSLVIRFAGATQA